MSEPQHIKEILPDVMQDIHKRRVLFAIKGFYRDKKPGPRRRKKNARGVNYGNFSKTKR